MANKYNNIYSYYMKQQQYEHSRIQQDSCLLKLHKLHPKAIGNTFILHAFSVILLIFFSLVSFRKALRDLRAIPLL